MNDKRRAEVERIERYRDALLETFGFHSGIKPEEVMSCLALMSPGRVLCFQMVLRGIGYHTETFNPGGDPWQQTLESWRKLSEAVEFTEDELRDPLTEAGANEWF